MNKIGTILAGIVLLFGMTACGGDEAAAPAQPTVTVTEAPEVDVEETFIEVVRDEYPELATIPDSDIIGIAQDACAMFDEGASAEDVFVVLIDTGASDEALEAMAFTIGAGTAAFCPEHEHLFDGGSTL